MVTGAASGMGAADTRLLAEEGASVIAGDVDRARLDAMVAEWTDEGLSVTGVTLDASRESDWAAAVGLAENTYGDVGILVNNAGVYLKVGLEATTPDIWQKIIGINQTGVLLGMQAVLAGMRRLGGGSIVNIASIHGIVGTTTATAYHASKGAVRSLSRQAACELGAEGIRVNSLDPGYTETAILLEARARGIDVDRNQELIPLKRFASPREIATAVVFLASDDASYITGTDLVVDGGLIAQQ